MIKTKLKITDTTYTNTTDTFIGKGFEVGIGKV